MKHFTFPLSLMMLLFLTMSSFKVQVNGPIAKFDKTEHDFGTIKKGDKAEFEFKLTNTGTEPLIISDVIKTCGCTVPTWPKKPVLAGESTLIKVTYDSKRTGPFSKAVVVKSNDPTRPEIRLKVSGVVEDVEEAEIEEIKNK